MTGGDGQPITINVLGELTVARGGEPVALPPSKKTRALLAYLAVSARPQRRERLCEIFWDVPDDPRGALRWSLSKLRKILAAGDDSPIEADRNTVALARGGITVDLDRVSCLDDAAIAAADLADLEAAEELFRGAFLEDLSLSRCPDFEAWRTAQADELEFLHVRLLAALIDRLDEEPERALHYAHKLQALRPDDEELPGLIERLGVAARSAGPLPEHPAGGGGQPVPEARRAEEEPAYQTPRVMSVGPGGREQEIRSCLTPDGVRVAFAVTGEGPPVVRAAHWMSHLEYDWTSPVWRHWVDALSDGMRLVRYDERGNGLSQRDVEDISFEAMVADLEAIVDAAGLDRFTLLGLLQGCSISIAYAVRHPERVKGLVLYGGYARGWRRRADPAQVAQREALTTLIGQGWGQDQPIFRQFFTSIYLAEASREQMDWFNELQRQTISPENAIRFHESFADVDVSDLLAKVSVPTLVMHARGDRTVPLSAGIELGNRIADARFVELDSANHILMADEPAFARFISELSGFVHEVNEEAPRPPASDLTRKQITALNAEIISPLQVLEGENLEQVMQVLDPMFDLACETVERHGGTIISSGDFTLAAVWGAPLAIEDHALRACRCALALKKGVEAASQGQARVRIGLDTGEAIIRPQRGKREAGLDIVSNVVRRAGQIAGALKQATIAVTGQTRSLVGGAMKMERVEDGLAGGSGRERVYELVAENRALSRWHLRTDQGLTRLVGRTIEMSILAEAWQRAREGHGQLVGIVADPGVGKSRLSHEFLASEGLRNFTILECGALEFDENVPLQVARTMLESLFELDEGIDPAKAAESVAKDLAELGADAALAAPVNFVLNLPVRDAAWLALDASDRIESVCEAVRAVLQLECRQKPVALLVEDLHWIDAESERVLNRIIDGMMAQRLLIIANYRPEYSHGWAQKSLFQQVRLGALTAQETDDFLETLLGGDPSVAHLRPLLAEKSDGTPLFLEEMVRMLAETGRLSGEPGRFQAPEAIGELQIPPSVKPIIAARIDRLADEDRKVLQIASVIGKDVPRTILKALSGLKRLDLDAVVARLNQTEFLFEVQSYPDIEYTFKHALTHDVAYESLVAEDRRRIHAEALRLMERLYEGQVEQHAEKLADHALRAEDWDAAARYLLVATDRSLDHAAYSKAAQFLEHAARALDMLERTPERVAQAIDIRTRMRPALEGIGRYAESLTRLDEAEALAEEIGDTDRLEQVILHRSYAYSTHGRLDLAIADADRLSAIARESGDPRFAAEADLAASQGLIFRSVALEVIERLTPHEAGFTGEWRMTRFGLLGTRSVFFLGYLSMSASLIGDLDRGWTLAEAMNAVVQESGRPIDRFAAAFQESTYHIVSGPTLAYEQRLSALAEECRARAPHPFYCVLLSRLGHTRLLCRGPEEAAETLDEAIAQSERSDMPHIQVYAEAIRACAESQINGPEAMPLLTAALERVRENRDQWLEVIVLRAMADVTEPEAALAHLDEAQSVAEEAGYRPELARIWAARADIAEQHDAKLARKASKQADALFAELGLSGSGEIAAGG